MPISWREMVQRLRVLGFTGPEAGGKHPVMRRGSQRITMVNPHGRDISDAMLNRIVRQAGVSREEFDNAK